MTAKNDFHIVAAIDVGSKYLHMTIAEIINREKFCILENLIKPTNIGRDTFSDHRISIQTIQETCSDLKGFSQLMKDYRIRNYKAVSTSGLREAENSEYIVEQIRLSSGIDVDVINTSEESFLTFKALRHHMVKWKPSSEESFLVVNVTSGGIEISLFKKGILDFSEYIKLGSLRLSEILSDLETMTMEFPKVMEEYIESKISLLRSRIQGLGAGTFIGLGGELGIILNLCRNKSDKDNSLYIDKSNLYKLYSRMQSMSTDQIIQSFGVSKKEAEILLPSVIIFHCFLNLTKFQGIYAPLTSLSQGLLYNIAEELYYDPENDEDYNEILNYAWYIANKYNVDKNHSAFVEKTASSIFEQTVRLHRLSERDRLYLEVAAILHDAGQFINFSEPDMQTYDIILNQNILGLSGSEIILTANAARYHGLDIPSMKDNNYIKLNEKEKITISKLAAILKLADSLDVSRRQKITDLDISILSDRLYFKISSNTDTLLEEWDFNHNASFFEEVMGIKPEIKHKGW